jgi:DMSO/TMAO reductase YedYZ molybdopterin-dependent catalytic subunit
VNRQAAPTGIALTGIAAAAVGLGVAELVAAVAGPRSAPLVAVGAVVVDAAPEPLKQFAIDVFGRADKIALLAGTVVLLAAFAALLGVVALRHRWYGFAGVGLFAAVGMVAALTRPGATWTWLLPSLIGGVAAAATLHALLGGPAAPDRPSAPRRDRRWLLVAAGGAVVAGVSGRLLRTRLGVAAARDALVLPAPAGPAPAVPTGADLRLPDLTPYLTANRDFYRIDTALTLPQVDPDTWRLRVHGRARRPMVLTFAQLLERPMVERHITLCCVSNEVGGDLIGNARWLGVPVKDLLDEVEPLDGADQVLSRSADGFTCGTPTAVLRDGRDALLAVGMNGEPLPVRHGFPVRMVTPGLYGYVSACKWLVELELTSFADVDAYWVRRGWAARGAVKTQSRIDVPRRGSLLAAGPVTVAGVAWAQHVGIAKVEVSVDGGQWHEATLADTVSIDTWRQWTWSWPAPPGRHRLRVRATDGTGATQPEQARAVFPDGATGWHAVDVTVG